MVEISKSGSGEGPGWETGPGYSTGVRRDVTLTRLATRRDPHPPRYATRPLPASLGEVGAARSRAIQAVLRPASAPCLCALPLRPPSGPSAPSPNDKESRTITIE